MLKKLIKTVNEFIFPADVNFTIVGAKTFFIKEITNDRIMP